MKLHQPLLVATLGLLAAAIAYTCSGPVEAPTWDITKSGHVPDGSSAILSPALRANPNFRGYVVFLTAKR